MALEDILLMVVTIILIAILIYFITKLLVGRKELDGGYILMLLITACIAVVILPVLSVIVGTLSLNEIPGLVQIVPILAFVCTAYAVKYLVLPSTDANYDHMEKALWITLIVFLVIFIINAVCLQLFGWNLLDITL